MQAVGGCCDERERGPGVGHRIPCRTEHRDLTEVVHQPQRLEPHRLCGAGHRQEPVALLGAATRPVERRQLQAEAERDWVGHLALPGRGGGGDRRGRGPHRLRRQQHVPPLGLDARSFLGQGPHLPADDALRHRLVPGPIAALPLRHRHLEHHADGRQPVAAREREPPSASLGVEPERVDHRGEPAAEPLDDDALQQVERVVGGRQVVDPVTDERAQRIARHDLAGREVRGRPRRLPRAGGSHEHHQARRGEDDLAQRVAHANATMRTTWTIR